MTKKEFKRRMRALRMPPVKLWNEMVEQAIRAGAVGYKSAEGVGTYFALTVAITTRYADALISSVRNEKVRRKILRDARNILKFI